MAAGIGGSGAAAGGLGSAAAASMGSAGGGASTRMLALMTNPWTIGIATAAIGGLLLFNHFSHAIEKNLRDAIKSTYGVDYKSDWQIRRACARRQRRDRAPGKALLSRVRNSSGGGDGVAHQ